MAKKAKHSDAVMTGILVTKFQMGLLDVEDLEQMAADTTRAERCSAAKNGEGGRLITAVDNAVIRIFLVASQFHLSL